MDCSTPGFPVLPYLLEFTQTCVHWVGDAIQPSHPLLPSFSSCLQSFLASGSLPVSRLFELGSQVLELQLQDHFPVVYSGAISFRIGWLNIFALQETLKSLIQHHSLKASILWHSAFFIVQLSHPYMTTGKWDEMVGWYHQLSRHEFEQASGDGDEQGSLACCNPWGHKESDMTEQLNWLNA